MVLAAFLFIRRMAETTSVRAISRELDDDDTDDDDMPYARELPPGVVVYEVNGPFFFGAAEKFKDTLARVSAKPRVLIIRMRNVPSLDSTALHALKDVVHRSRNDGTRVILAELGDQPRAVLEGSQIMEELGRGNVFDSIEAAIDSQ